MHMSYALPVWRGLSMLREYSMLREQVASTDSGRAAADSVRSEKPLTDLLAQRRLFLRFLARRIRSAEVAEDILQNACLRALENGATLRDDESAIAWFYRILRNAVIDHYRRSGVEQRALSRWGTALEADREPSPGSLPHSVICRCIARVLPSLGPAYAEILDAVDLQEGKLETFAADHGISRSNATVRIHRARKALKERLAATCGACSHHGCLDCSCR